LQALPDGSIGLDIGCGNGKYLAVNKRIFIIGSDRSTNLTRIASTHEPHSAIVADTLALPHPPRAFDFAISIAVVHHLSTPERRIEAVRSILGTLRLSSGIAGEPGRALIYVWALEQKESRRGWDEGGEQDVMVPWVMRAGGAAKKKAKGKGKSNGGEESQKAEEVVQEQPAEQAEDKTFLRYYHLYRKGELEHDIEEAGGTVVESGYEKDNWWAIAIPKS
jgi:tRNA (uracil-5-)-methyltransferase TRM9